MPSSSKMQPAFNEDKDREAANEWMKLGLRVGVCTAIHPFDYAKTLIQIGFEPMPAVPATNIFGRPVMALPNIFQYTGYIKNTDGFMGLFRGLSPKLIGVVLGNVVSHHLADSYGLVENKVNEEEMTDDQSTKAFVARLKRDVFIQTITTIVSHPFHVVSLRMIAQFVGKETKYNTTFSSIVTIIREEGFLGLFTGLISRLTGDLLLLLLAGGTTFVAKKYVVRDREHQTYFEGFNSFLWAGILYPFTLVSTCTIVSGSGLAAGRPPNMPLYGDWTNCYRALRREGQLKRGSSVFFRYTKPMKHTYSSAPYPSLRLN